MLTKTLDELTELDSTMRLLEIGDCGRLAASLERRNQLVQTAAAEIARLRGSGTPVPADTQRRLQASADAGMHTMRQVILAKHMLATELGRLKQEQRLFEALSGGQEQVGQCVELRG